MALIVQKFGGSSVADAERVRHVAEIVTRTYDQGNDVIVVVSAQGDTTDDLIEKAKEINPTPSKREMDMLLSTGEQISISLLAMAIEKLGYPVISLTGWQIGMKTNSKYSNARIRHCDTERLQSELDKKKIIIVAGFQGINKYDDITTLGRGGSDTTAVAIAAVMKAQLCQIYTDVDGVYTADPRKVPTAVKLDEITFDEMLELASMGAQVLHNRSVELAKKYDVNMEVVSSFNDVPGTKVKEVVKVEKMLVRGVAKDTDVMRVTILGVVDEPGIAFKIFSTLASKGVNVDIIIQCLAQSGKNDISFTVKQSEKDIAKAAVEGLADRITFDSISYSEDVAKVSIVGAGMVSNPGVAAQMFEALAERDINIQMISTSEIKVSVLIAEEDADRAVRAIHDMFIKN